MDRWIGRWLDGMEKNGVFFPKHSTNQPSKTHPTTHPFHSSVQKMASIGHRFMQPFQQYKQDHPIPRKARHPDPLEVTPHIKMRQPPYDFSSRVGDLEEASDSSSGPSSRWEPLSGRERSASSTPIHGRSPFLDPSQYPEDDLLLADLDTLDLGMDRSEMEELGVSDVASEVEAEAGNWRLQRRKQHERKRGAVSRQAAAKKKQEQQQEKEQKEQPPQQKQSSVLGILGEGGRRLGRRLRSWSGASEESDSEGSGTSGSGTSGSSSEGE